MAIGTAARADRVLYFDFDKSGVATDSDVSMRTNESAVAESIMNILRTEPRSRVYKQRDFGAGLDQYLFEQIDIITAQRMLDTIETAIGRFEPRAKSVKVTITPKEDLNTYQIEVTANIDESNREISLNTTLERLR